MAIHTAKAAARAGMFIDTAVQTEKKNPGTLREEENNLFISGMLKGMGTAFGLLARQDPVADLMVKHLDEVFRKNGLRNDMSPEEFDEWLGQASAIYRDIRSAMEEH